MKRSLLLLSSTLIVPILLLGVPVCRAQESAVEDSLRREMLLLALHDAEIEADRTDLWHRLMPHIEVSAGLSAGDLFFAGPDATTYVVPKDAYRLSVGLGLSGLFDTAPHEKALVELQRRLSELALADAKLRDVSRSRMRMAARRDTLRAILAEELALRQESVNFQTLLFDEGKGGFDDLLRSKLALLAARRSALLAGEPPASLPEEK